MDFNIDDWLDRLLEALQKTFADRLIYVGHTGSYARGEQTPGSDIDVNIILDVLTAEDLASYRAIIRGMPFREKACGFIGGRAQIKAWPRHELFLFTRGSKILYGSLEGIVDPPTDSEIQESMRSIASAVYHEVCHRYIFCQDLTVEAEELKTAYKTAFFLLQEQEYLKTRRYVPTKKELLTRLDGPDREILAVCLNWEDLKNDRRKRPDPYFALLQEWCGLKMKGL